MFPTFALFIDYSTNAHLDLRPLPQACLLPPLFNVPPNPPDGSDRRHVHALVYILVYETWSPQCVNEC